MNGYVLFNPAEARANDYWEGECYGFWSNEFGYVELYSATIFSKSEIDAMDFFPKGCFAVELPTLTIKEV